MPKIIQLQQHIADLIAAGEVVARPASVVKELVENSIDAGAGTITVEIASGGMASIRVTDNGCGIAPDEVKTAFLRHATSKLRDAKGLESIETLGFRGEALAAIAAVSRIELVTREPLSSEGVRLTLEAGTVKSFEPAGSPEGTTIIVRDLFFNTPARLKFMKTDRAEGSAVSSIITRCALSRPDISFRYIKDGKTEFHTPGDSKIDSCIYSLLGRDLAQDFLPVEMSVEPASVKGFTSLPGLARGNRSNQYFFVNGRVVRSVLLQSALEQAYRNTLMTGRFPACVLYITTGASNVDVNVHPAKTEVRFISDKQIFDAVYYSVLGALDKTQEVQDEGFSAYTASFRNPLPQTQKLPSTQGSNAPASYPRQASYQTGQNHYPAQQQYYQEVSEAPPLYSAHTPLYRVIGQALDTYIIIEQDDSVVFIDKHAAHERVHYNAYQSGKYEPMSESLIAPIVCRTGAVEAQRLLDNAELLDTLGFAIESFGEDAVAVRCIPSDIHQRDVESVLSDICSQLNLDSAIKTANLDKIHKSLSCKAAIKAGDTSDIRELEELAGRVMSGEITHCPHGRPVMFALSKTTLEKNFGRLG